MDLKKNHRVIKYFYENEDQKKVENRIKFVVIYENTKILMLYLVLF